MDPPEDLPSPAYDGFNSESRPSRYTHEPQFRFDVFASYSTIPDYLLVRDVKRLVETFHALPGLEAKELSKLKMCVDGIDFHVPWTLPWQAGEKARRSSQLQDVVERHLSQSHGLLVFCCPNAASSVWVDLEVKWFLQRRPEAILLVVTDGADPAKHPEKIFPRRIIEAGLHKGAWYDFRRYSILRSWRAVASRSWDEARLALVARLYDCSPRDLESTFNTENLRQQRKRTKIVGSISTALALLAGVAIYFAIAENTARRAKETARKGEETQRRKAEANAEETRRQLVEIDTSNGLRQMDEGDDFGAMLWFVEALSREQVPESSAVSSAVEREWQHRFRIGAITRHSPRILTAWDSGGPLAIVSNDRSMLATARPTSPAGSEVQVWSLPSGKPLAPPFAHPDSVLRIAFDGEDHLLTTLTTKDAYTWRIKADNNSERQVGLPVRIDRVGAVLSPGGTLAAIPSMHGLDIIPTRMKLGGPQKLIDGKRVSRVWFSPRGTRLAATHDGIVDVFDSDSDSITFLLSIHPPMSTEWISFSEDDKRVLTMNGEFLSPREVHVWDGTSGEQIGPTLKYSTELLSACFSPDGTSMLVATKDGTVVLVEAESGQTKGKPMRHRKELRTVQFDPDGQFVMTNGGDGVRLWDLAGEPLTPWMESDAWLSAVTLLDNGILSVSSDGLVTIWEIGEPPEWIKVGSDISQVQSAAFDPTGATLALGLGHDLAALSKNSPQALALDGFVRIWNFASSRMVPRVKMPHESAVEFLQFNVDGSLLFSATNMGDLAVWDSKTGQPLGPDLPAHEPGVRAFAFSSDGSRVATIPRGASDISLIDRNGGRERKIAMPASPITLAFSPNGNVLAAIENIQFTLRLFDSTTAEAREQFSLKGFLTNVGFSLDGQHIGVGGIGAVNTSSGAWLITPQTGSIIPLPPAPSVAFSPDSARCAIATGDKVELREVTTGQSYLPGIPQGGLAREIVFSPDMKYFVTLGQDNAARLWDVRTGRVLSAPLLHHGSSLHHIAVSPDGHRVVTCGDQGTAGIWEFTPDERPLADVRSTAELLAGHRLDKRGDVINLTKDEWLDRWHFLLATEQSLVTFTRAIRAGDEDRALEIIRARPDLIGLSSEKGLTALHMAAAAGSVRALQALLERRANPNCTTPGGDRPLHTAVWANSVEAVRLLLAAGAIPNLPSDFKSPLHSAAREGHSTIAELLLDASANPSSVSADGDSETPLHAAAQKGSTDTIELLLDHGALVDAQMTGDFDGVSALHLAIANKHADAVRLLLARGADRFRRGVFGTAIEIARRSSDPDILLLLTDERPPLAP